MVQGLSIPGVAFNIAVGCWATILVIETVALPEKTIQKEASSTDSIPAATADSTTSSTSASTRAPPPFSNSSARATTSPSIGSPSIKRSSTAFSSNTTITSATAPHSALIEASTASKSSAITVATSSPPSVRVAPCALFETSSTNAPPAAFSSSSTATALTAPDVSNVKTAALASISFAKTAGFTSSPTVNVTSAHSNAYAIHEEAANLTVSAYSSAAPPSHSAFVSIHPSIAFSSSSTDNYLTASTRSSLSTSVTTSRPFAQLGSTFREVPNDTSVSSASSSSSDSTSNPYISYSSASKLSHFTTSTPSITTAAYNASTSSLTTAAAISSTSASLTALPNSTKSSIIMSTSTAPFHSRYASTAALSNATVSASNDARYTFSTYSHSPSVSYIRYSSTRTPASSVALTPSVPAVTSKASTSSAITPAAISSTSAFVAALSNSAKSSTASSYASKAAFTSSTYSESPSVSYIRYSSTRRSPPSVASTPSVRTAAVASTPSVRTAAYNASNSSLTTASSNFSAIMGTLIASSSTPISAATIVFYSASTAVPSNASNSSAILTASAPSTSITTKASSSTYGSDSFLSGTELPTRTGLLSLYASVAAKCRDLLASTAYSTAKQQKQNGFRPVVEIRNAINDDVVLSTGTSSALRSVASTASTSAPTEAASISFGLISSTTTTTTTRPSTDCGNTLMSTAYRDTALAMHNNFRSLVATGRARNGEHVNENAPPSSRMDLMVYDCMAEQLAFNHVITCDKRLSSPSARPNYKENTQVLTTTSNDGLGAIQNAIATWSNELATNGIPSHMVLTGQVRYRVTRKVTKVSKILWGSNRYVGCATVKCNGFFFTSCMYREPVNIVGQSIYSIGAVCSACHAGHNNCNPLFGLCAW